MKILNFQCKYSPLLVIILVFSNLTVIAQEIRFNKNADLIKVKKGDVVRIQADTAFVISLRRAKALNERIKELDHVKSLYNNLADGHNEMIAHIDSVQQTLALLLGHMKSGEQEVQQGFKELVDQLNGSIKNLKSSNKKLKVNNEAMKGQIDKLEKEMKQLKKQTRKIWWNGLTDKLVAFAGGVCVGGIIAILLI